MQELERKFILKYLPEGLEPVSIQQGYLMFEGKKHLRCRIVGDKGFITFKRVISKFEKDEFEYEIPLRDAEELMASTDIKLDKVRYKTEYDGNQVDIDFYPSSGIYIAEIEYEEELKSIPDYCGEEVTGKSQFSNIRMAKENAKNKSL
jgi:adenylate cyclase